MIVGMMIVTMIIVAILMTIVTREADPSGQVFQRGYVLYGIYLPSLSGRLQVCHHFHHHSHFHHRSQDPKLEDAYQKYAHRQRQKALILVNFSDLLLKVFERLPSILDHHHQLYTKAFETFVKVIVLLKVVCILPLRSIQELNQDACVYRANARSDYFLFLCIS